MLVADAIGIIVGLVLGKNIPERAVKWFAAVIFIAFGVIGLYGATPRHIWTPTVIAAGPALLLILIYAVVQMGKAKEAEREDKPDLCAGSWREGRVDKALR